MLTTHASTRIYIYIRAQRVRKMEFANKDVERAIDSAMRKAGIQQLKKEQRSAIQEFVSGKDVFVSIPTGCGKDVFVSLPTGYGKSFCYALLPAVFDDLRSNVGS